jgi:hypothetical protein
VSNTQIIIVLAISVSTIIILGCLVVFVIVRLRRVVKSQFETLESLLSSMRSGQGGDEPGEPSSKK